MDINLGRLGVAVACLLAGLPGVELGAAENTSPQDVVTLSAAEGTRTLKGRILNYSGSGLKIELSGGLQKSIPANAVVDVQLANPSTAQRAARLAVQAGQFEKALQGYRRLLDSGREKRPWVQRKILAEMIECQQALGRHEQAAGTFIELLEEDPTTPYFAKIPLAWTATDQINPEKSSRWLESEHPAVRLLGASYLLTTRRDRALGVLKSLMENPDQNISALATAEWLRTRVPQASPKEIQLARESLERLLPALRGGPYYVLGQLYAAQGEHRQAAIAMMHVPILFPQRQQLAAESLLTAGKSMVKSGLPADAVRVYQELLESYPKSMAALEAKQRQQELVNQLKDS